MLMCAFTLLLSPASRRWSIHGLLRWLGTFCVGTPMGQLPVYGGASGGAGRRGVSDLFRGCSSANSVPLMAPRLYLTEWMDKKLKLGYSLKFCGVPPPFGGVREANLSSQEEISSAWRFRTSCRNRRCLYRHTTERKGSTPHTSWFPRRREVSCPF